MFIRLCCELLNIYNIIIYKSKYIFKKIPIAENDDITTSQAITIGIELQYLKIKQFMDLALVRKCVLCMHAHACVIKTRFNTKISKYGFFFLFLLYLCILSLFDVTSVE